MAPVQVSQQSSLMQALAKLVQAPADQAKQPAQPNQARARVSVPKPMPDQGIPNFAQMSESDFDRRAPRGSYLNIVV